MYTTLNMSILRINKNCSNENKTEKIVKRNNSFMATTVTMLYDGNTNGHIYL